MTEKEMDNGPWKNELMDSVTDPEKIRDRFDIDCDGLKEVCQNYPMRVSPYYFNLIRQRGDPIYRQCIPDPEEIRDMRGEPDPLDEEGFSPVRGLTHRYPDRVLFLVSSICATYCRFCNRKRKVGSASMVTEKSIDEGILYISDHDEVRDVLLSGGDPLLLDDDRLFEILKRLRAIGHVEIIRIGTRVPCTFPSRVTERLAGLLAGFHPVYVNTHFNHPMEITPESTLACTRLADAGIPLGSHTVLLRGVNDDESVMKSLMQKLLSIRVRPYYIFQADHVRGTSHFWTPLETGIRVMKGLVGHTTGLCVPHFALDLPGGGGKVPVLPQYVVEKSDDSLLIRNYLDKSYKYPLYEG